MVRIVSLFILSIFVCLVCSCHNQAQKVYKAIPSQTNKIWAGKWERTDFQNEGSIEIKAVNKDTFDFNISGVNGAHTGEIEGKGIIYGDSATFISEEEKGCELYFKLTKDYKKIIISATDSCQAFGGVGVYFDGDFWKDPPVKNETLQTLGILNKKQNDEFKKLVGSDYNRYVSCSQLVDDSGNDLDELHTKVITSGVRGLYTVMEYIIMIDSSRHIWTAVIDTNSKVKYYTNDDLYQNKIPKTIDDWRSGFKDYPIIYESKK